MLQKRTIYGYLLLSGLLLLAACTRDGADQPRRTMPDLTESYSGKDKKPFGTYIAYRELEEMFYHNTIRNDKRSVENSWNDIQDDTASVYVCIAGSLYTTDEDVHFLTRMAENGNDVFLAVRDFEPNLLSELGIKTQSVFPPGFFNGKPYTNTGVRLRESNVADTTLYSYFYYPFTKYFSKYDSATTRILGVNEDGNPNFIVMFRGKGKIFLHCEPRAFSNYFLLQKENYRYLQQVFGFLHSYPDHFYWNEYYVKLHSRPRNSRSRDEDKSFNSLDEILSHPPLAAAFWLGLTALLLYVFFGAKRRQRVIDVIKPNENTTVAFAETIGRLYLQKKDNRNIADKMITFFNEHVRNHYYLNTNLVNDDFITTLSRKSGVPREKVESLYRAIDHAHSSVQVDDYQLLSLNELMQFFYERAARERAV